MFHQDSCGVHSSADAAYSRGDAGRYDSAFQDTTESLETALSPTTLRIINAGLLALAAVKQQNPGCRRYKAVQHDMLSALHASSLPKKLVPASAAEYRSNKLVMSS